MEDGGKENKLTKGKLKLEEKRAEEEVWGT